MSESAPPIFLGKVFSRKQVAFAGYTLLIYDYLLTLDLEVSHIWNEHWTAVKLLFLINRYGNLIGQTFIMLEETGYLSRGSRHFCIAFELCSPLFAILSGESIRLFVVMRACAILGCRRGVALLANALYIFYAIIMSVLLTGLFLLHVHDLRFEFLNQVGLCISPVAPNIWIFWLIPLLFDTLVLVLVCCSLYQLNKGSGGLYSSRLIRLLARDGILFYLATLFNGLFSAVCWSVYRKDPRNFLQTLITYPFLSVMGQRLVLNLRRSQSQIHSTHDLSQEVDRQIAAVLVDVGLELDRVNIDESN